MSNDDDDRPYRVGKGKPPLEHRWKKGQPSPNPKGRPKGRTAATELQQLLRQKVEVRGPDGRVKRKTFGAIIAHKLVERAVKDDFAAIKLISQLTVKSAEPELTAAEAARAERQEAEDLAARKALSARLVRLLQDEASRKKGMGDPLKSGPDFRPINDDDSG
jgi:hypothetical protein